MTTANSDPHGIHDWHSASYVEAWITSDVTRDSERQPFLRRTVQLLPVDHDKPVQVLDVGGGYGMLSREVLEVLPRSTVVLQDLSEAMLEQAKTGLAQYQGRVRFVQADLRDPHWVNTVGGPFDSVVSSIAIHNVRHPDLIQKIYTEIYDLVVLGGSFFNLDFVTSDPSGTENTHSSTGETAQSRQNRPDRGTVADHLRWLKEAGFQNVEFHFQEGHQALVAGYRSR
jgi:ubiquinone/menaquinone biosynthesis C-methylase UbiE